MAHATYADVERAVDKLAVTALVIRQQRDELLAALEGLRDELGKLGNYLHNLTGPLPSGDAKAIAVELARLFEPARAAIAKAKA